MATRVFLLLHIVCFVSFVFGNGEMAEVSSINVPEQGQDEAINNYKETNRVEMDVHGTIQYRDHYLNHEEQRSGESNMESMSGQLTNNGINHNTEHIKPMAPEISARSRNEHETRSRHDYQTRYRNEHQTQDKIDTLIQPNDEKVNMAKDPQIAPRAKVNHGFPHFSGNFAVHDMCDRYDVDGCSIPLGAPFFFKSLFTKPCYRHDICYGCGVEYNVTRKDCDYAFKGNMRRTCLANYGNNTGKIMLEHKQHVVEIMDALKDTFDVILMREMNPVENEALLDVFQTHAQNVHDGVIKKWAELLMSHLPFHHNKKNKKTDRPIKDAFQLDFDSSQLVFDNTKAEFNEDQLSEHKYSTTCQDILSYVKDKNADRKESLGEVSCEEVELLSCLFFDHIYFMAVRIFAFNSYHNKPEYYCSQPFVEACLKPVPV